MQPPARDASFPIHDISECQGAVEVKKRDVPLEAITFTPMRRQSSPSIVNRRRTRRSDYLHSGQKSRQCLDHHHIEGRYQTANIVSMEERGGKSSPSALTAGLRTLIEAASSQVPEQLRHTRFGSNSPRETGEKAMQ